MDQRRWSNISSARHAYDRAAEAVDCGPIEAFFEVAARCNLRCQMCAINYDARYQPRSGRPPFFEPDLFARLRPIFPSLLRAYLFGLGEPTLNRHLVDYIRELSAAGVEVWFNTNATLIDDEKAEEIAAAGADKITVSIDGATAETYEEIRRGARFESVIRGIRALTRAGKRYGRPAVNLSFVAMASNIHELPAMIDLAAELDTTGVHVEPLFAQPASADLMDHYSRENLGATSADRVAAMFDAAFDRAYELGVSLATRFAGERDQFDYVRRVRGETIDWTCSEPWSSIWVTSAGEVRTCCVNETSFGNLSEHSIEEIWNGEMFRRFRSQHARREIATGCANCVANGRARQSPYFRAVQRVTYRPVTEKLPEDLTDGDVVIETPRPGETVSDPLVILGRIRTRSPIEIEVMVDDTPVQLFTAGGLLHRRFGVEAPIQFVTEGAHIVWLRRLGAKRGWGQREIFLWRPATPASPSPLRPARPSARPAERARP